MPAVTNISCYKFAPLDDLKPLRERLLTQCKQWQLKGTILLSTEGINMFVAGPREWIDELVNDLRTVPGLEDLNPKISLSDEQPFNRMLVRIKKEIIAFGVEGIDPARNPAPRLLAKELKQWLDEGRPVTLLDTRNDYEVKLGTFRNALPIGVNHFRDFPAALEKLSPELKEQPVVAFCTGGIRCEKAAPLMQRVGFKNVFQLEGGILKYFEEVGGDHYDGECFVFDQRVGVDPSLSETEKAQCFACLSPLTEEEQQDPRYQPPKSCPHCFVSDEEQRARAIAERQAAIERATTPLPGSVPYDNSRPLTIPAAYDGKTLIEFLKGLFPHVASEQWLPVFESRSFVNGQRVPVGPEQVVRAGEYYMKLESGTVEPEVNPAIRILYEDEAIIVLHKPAPLPMHPCGRFNRNTLQKILAEVYAPQSPRPAHRLDANTTGIVVLGRTRRVAGILQPQFAQGIVHKTYLARVHGQPLEDEFVCDRPISDAAGPVGSREIDEEGSEAVTEFRVLERLADGTTLLEAYPVTGRTNQIRVHLWSLGFPIVGDSVYLPNGQLGSSQTLPLDAPPLCLQSQRISFRHPLTRERVEFTTEVPEWVAATLTPSP